MRTSRQPSRSARAWPMRCGRWWRRCSRRRRTSWLSARAATRRSCSRSCARAASSSATSRMRFRTRCASPSATARRTTASWRRSAMRRAELSRTTKETSVQVALDLDGSGAARIETPVVFLSHMLDTIARHARVDLEVTAVGDVHIDYHHTVEDVGLVLGETFASALGDKAGIRRFGTAYVPLDEALARVVVDFAGRPFLVFEVPIDKEMLLIHKDFPL